MGRPTAFAGVVGSDFGSGGADVLPSGCEQDEATEEAEPCLVARELGREVCVSLSVHGL